MKEEEEEGKEEKEFQILVLKAPGLNFDVIHETAVSLCVFFLLPS